MFRSIRWRLVASYVLLTLLTVSLVGVLALSLLERYVEQQEQEYLRANAETVARQALPMIQPALRQADLRDLASTASFLGNVRVRILDERYRVLADSGSPTGVDEFVWVVTPTGVGFPFPGASETSLRVFPLVRPHSAEQVSGRESPFILEQLPPETEVMVVHREGQPWGTRFTFEDRSRLEAVMKTRVMADAPVLHATVGEWATPRSEQVVSVPIGEADADAPAEGGEYISYDRHVENPLGYVELSQGPDVAAEALATARRAFLFAAGGATLLAVVVGLLMGRGLTAPLRGLMETTGRMSSGDLAVRAPVRGKDEIGQLARQFNRMAGQLETSFTALAAERDSLRRFVADASHELRTPITALKNFNTLLQGAAAGDPQVQAEFLAESQRQLERLEWITHNLLDLSRLDAGLAALDLADHDAQEMVREAAAAFKVQAQEKNVTLAVRESPSPLPVRCDRERIESALFNLLDNALKFTPAGGEVEIGAQQADEGVRLWVQDSGPGIAPADRERIFERFYRGPHADAQGVGLGLAIVRSIVQAHGGCVTVESEPGTGSRFAIHLRP